MARRRSKDSRAPSDSVARASPSPSPSIDHTRASRALLGAIISLVSFFAVILGRGPLAPIRITAWAALGALFAALACSPYVAIARRVGTERARRYAAIVLRTRRGIGVIAFAFALVHAALAFTLHLGFDVRAIIDVDRFRHGALALLLLLPLAITSSDWVLSRLRLRAWTALHRAAYPAAILALAHAIRGPFSSSGITLGAAGLLALVLAARLVPRLLRPKLPTRVL